MCKVQKQRKGKGDRFNWEVLREGLTEAIPDRLLDDEQTIVG